MTWRWPWRRKKTGMAHADAAVAESQQRLDEAREQTSYVQELAEELRRIRRVNQLGARFSAAFREHR